MDIGRHEGAQFAELLDHGGNDEPDYPGNYGGDENEGDDDAEGTGGHMEPILHELHDGVEQIGYEPCDEEWQQCGAEVVDDKQDTNDEQSDECPTYESVECDFLLKHFVGFIDLRFRRGWPADSRFGKGVRIPVSRRVARACRSAPSGG